MGAISAIVSSKIAIRVGLTATYYFVFTKSLNLKTASSCQTLNDALLTIRVDTGALAVIAYGEVSYLFAHFLAFN